MNPAEGSSGIAPVASTMAPAGSRPRHNLRHARRAVLSRAAIEGGFHRGGVGYVVVPIPGTRLSPRRLGPLPPPLTSRIATLTPVLLLRQSCPSPAETGGAPTGHRRLPF